LACRWLQTVLVWWKNDDSLVLSHFREAFKVLDGG
jgi:hypothetical protein